MKAARVYEPGKIVIEDVPVPEPNENDVLIKVHRAGICGTDVSVVHGYAKAELPVTLGHEFSGTVAKVRSSSLTDFKEGEPVICGGGWGCGDCDFCRKGMGLYCKKRVSLGRNTDGCMAEFIKVDYRAVRRIPANVTFDEAQNTVNIACAVRAFKKVPLQLGKTVAVFGPGNAGLIMLQLLKMAGAYQAVMVGTRDFRLQAAINFGASHVVNVKKQDPVEAILKWFPDGVDVVIEASGNAGALQSCFSVVKPSGAVVVFGIFSDRIKNFDPSFLYYKEPVIYGSKGAAGAFEEALKLLAEKRLEILPMITHRFPLAETAAAFKVFEDKVPEALRIVIEVAP
ncbi:MAG: alcohol dehydrogenase catalytic domain-containing protein [Desulfobacterales bacterium]|nr:alcohol dehydrogenase catalytic domain-containing protein [Desulfobacterales bacterium]